MSRKAVGAALTVSFLWFLILVSLGDLHYRGESHIITIPSTRSLKFLKPMKAEKQSFNLNYVSKRKVPSGPDPIHNRRVGTTKIPPT